MWVNIVVLGLKDGNIEKVGEYVENGICKHRYKKKAIMVI